MAERPPVRVASIGPLAALRAALPAWFPRTNEIIRQLGSHNLLTTPARAALDDETLRPLLEKYLKGVDVDAEQRVIAPVVGRRVERLAIGRFAQRGGRAIPAGIDLAMRAAR